MDARKVVGAVLVGSPFQAVCFLIWTPEHLLLDIRVR